MAIVQAIMKLFIRLLLKLPGSWLVKMSGGTPTVIRGRTFDPRLQFVAAQAAKGPSMMGNPAEVREGANASLGLLEAKIRPMKRIDHRTIPGPELDIPVRIYHPHNLKAEGNPAIVYYHQGGCVIGTPDWCETFCTILAERCGAIVMNVDYRLAPEHKFPASFDDALAAFQWMVDNAAEFKVDPANIALAGDSAGGNLSAAISVHQRDNGGAMPKAQVLIYPWVTAAEEPPSRDDFAEAYPLNKELMEFFKGHYLPEGQDEADLRISPMSAPSHAGLPHSLIYTAGFDPLCDEGEIYAGKLKAAGVPVTFRCYESLCHSFTAFSGAIPAARAALNEIAGELNAVLNG